MVMMVESMSRHIPKTSRYCRERERACDMELVMLLVSIDQTNKLTCVREIVLDIVLTHSHALVLVDEMRFPLTHRASGWTCVGKQTNKRTNKRAAG